MAAGRKKPLRTKGPTVTREERDRQKTTGECSHHTVSALQKYFGKNEDVDYIEHYAKEEPVLGWVSTGSFLLDAAAGYPYGFGLPMPSIVEIVGTESSAKTTLACKIMANMQKIGGWGLFIDAERSFNQGYATSTGLSLREGKFVKADMCVIDDCLDCMIHAVKAHFEFSPTVPFCSILDSVPCTTTRSEEDGNASMAAHAKVIRNKLRQGLITGIHDHPCLLIFCNQLTATLKTMPGASQYASFGGSGLRYYSRVRIQLMVKEKLYLKDPYGSGNQSDPCGIRIKAEIIKSKIAAPHRKVEFDFRFDTGIEDYYTVMNMLERYDGIEMSGKQFVWNGKKYFSGKFRKFMRENPREWVKMKQMAVDVFPKAWTYRGSEEDEELAE